ncbi:MAG: hypothetical protein EOP82_10160 [Variovorax sp.]|nr:MAG: hypothetical protein EOP82_10160 [Variovorax sp.]
MSPSDEVATPSLWVFAFARVRTGYRLSAKGEANLARIALPLSHLPGQQRLHGQPVRARSEIT